MNDPFIVSLIATLFGEIHWTDNPFLVTIFVGILGFCAFIFVLCSIGEFISWYTADPLPPMKGILSIE